MNNLKYSKPSLKENEYHLWYTKPLDVQDLDLLARYKMLLTDQEIEKQQRYIFEKDRHDALITRAFIRDILSQYMDVEPSEWRFTKGDNGKPEIDFQSSSYSIPLRFNISHTKELIICAVTLSNDIGCDVEHVERKSDVLAIADRFFSTLETKELFSLPVTQQRDRFFDYWTLKESYIKAWGQGLAIPLSDFSFHIGESESGSTKQNNNIHLSFAEKREDSANDWQSWIFYPNSEHRVSVSIRQLDKNTSPDSGYRIRFFETKPLVSYEERSEISL